MRNFGVKLHILNTNLTYFKYSYLQLRQKLWSGHVNQEKTRKFCGSPVPTSNIILTILLLVWSPQTRLLKENTNPKFVTLQQFPVWSPKLITTVKKCKYSFPDTSLYLYILVRDVITTHTQFKILRMEVKLSVHRE